MIGYNYAISTRLHRIRRHQHKLYDDLPARPDLEVERAAETLSSALQRAAEDLSRYSCGVVLLAASALVDYCFAETRAILGAGIPSRKVKYALRDGFTLFNDDSLMFRALQGEQELFGGTPTGSGSGCSDSLVGFLTVQNLYLRRDRPFTLSWFGDLGRAVRSWPSQLMDTAKHAATEFLQRWGHKGCSGIAVLDILRTSEREACLPYPDRLHALRSLYRQDFDTYFCAYLVEHEANILVKCRLILEGLCLRESGEMLDPYSGRPFVCQPLKDGCRFSSIGPGVAFDETVPYARYLPATPGPLLDVCEAFPVRPKVDGG